MREGQSGRRCPSSRVSLWKLRLAPGWRSRDQWVWRGELRGQHVVSAVCLWQESVLTGAGIRRLVSSPLIVLRSAAVVWKSIMLIVAWHALLHGFGSGCRLYILLMSALLLWHRCQTQMRSIEKAFTNAQQKWCYPLLDKLPLMRWILCQGTELLMKCTRSTRCTNKVCFISDAVNASLMSQWLIFLLRAQQVNASWRRFLELLTCEKHARPSEWTQSKTKVTRRGRSCLRVCDWVRVGVINSSPRSDTLRRRSSWGATQQRVEGGGGYLQGRCWHQSCPHITCPTPHRIHRITLDRKRIIKIQSASNLCTVMGHCSTLWAFQLNRWLYSNKRGGESAHPFMWV